MHQSDEMFSRMVAQYGLKHLEKKKEKDFMKFINNDKSAPKVSAPKIVAPAPEYPDLKSLSYEEALKIKKDVSQMPASYWPKFVEQFWYPFWEKNKLFHADAQRALQTKKTYVMCLPPPNVTGYLHLGHALTSAIEDSLVRVHRMRGYETCYLPGVDHAGIATQNVVEKALEKQGLYRRKLGREEFLKYVWDWKEKHGAQILHQLRMVGSSLDWDRFRFTMDDQLQKAVAEAFVRLYEKGRIYRANRLVHWSCALKTAISDIEVTFEDLEEPKKIKVPGYAEPVEFGWITHFLYKIKDSDEHIEIATTRLETMLGDVAIAVNAQDPRYKHLHGKFCEHPFIKDRLLQIIVDDFVDINFGTGAVKVTPAHDPNDYECGNRHKLQFINIFDEDGNINENGGPYKGLPRFKCRAQLEEDMRKLGIFKGKKKNPMRLGFCSRSKDVIEPIIKPQWYLDCQHIKQRMIDVVKNGELQLIPSEYNHEWFRWMNNLKDWCISRQLWWGHRCPAYLVHLPNKIPDSGNHEDWIIARSYEEAMEKAAQKFNLPKDQIKLQQDEDVLDTWFSSGLFPFSTFQWPDTEHPDFQAFFPNSILETGWDILFFWVARMVQFSLEFFDVIPFKQVFLHPIIRDKDGKKMSKSLGNVIDPLEIIDGTSLDSLKQKILEGNLPKEEMERSIKEKEQEFPNGIPECGSDALRFGLLSYMQKTNNINLNVNHIIGYRQFCNKIWNSSRYALSKLDKGNYATDFGNLLLINKWILSKLNQTVQEINACINDFEFGQATQKFHGFWLYSFCDVYLEGIKNLLSEKNNDIKAKEQTQQTLFQCFEIGMRTLHPFMPYLSEEIWQKLPDFPNRPISLCIAKFPEAVPEWKDQAAVEQFEILQEIARILRKICSDSKLPPQTRPNTYALILDDQAQLTRLVQENSDIISLLARTKNIQIIEKEAEEHKLCGIGNMGVKIKLFVNLSENLDVEKEIQKLTKSLNEKVKLKSKLQEKMSQYTDKVPENVRKQDQQKLEQYEKEQALLEQQIQLLSEKQQKQNI